MTGGSDDTRPPTNEPNAVDAAWDALIGETGKGEEDSGRADDPGELSSADSSASDPTPSHAPTTSEALHSKADDEMARLMGGETPKLPATAAKPEPDAEAKPEPKPELSELRERPALQVVTGGVAASTPTPVVDERAQPEPTPRRAASGHDAPARASRPVEPSPPAPTPAPRGLPWAWIGAGAIALGAAAYLVTDEDKNDRRPEAPAPRVATPDPVRSATPPLSDRGATVEPPPHDRDDAGTSDSGQQPPPTNVEARTGDPREPPPDTPPEIAAVFRRLPVSPSDRPPVGGIGASGIHIDHIAMGSKTTEATCSGKPDDFSVSARERAGVCVRVVHPREKEELQVLWEKHGGSTRRSKMVVLPLHAYRTRGYLVLRSEYIGDWTVRILSSDGVELASHDFTVVP